MAYFLPMQPRRLFLAFEVAAPWPSDMPQGRMVAEEERHLTIAFLGNTHLSSSNMLLPPFKVGLAGRFDEILFLSNVAAYHVRGIDLSPYVNALIPWLKTHGVFPAEPFLPHVTVCRKPFDQDAWKDCPQLPMFLKHLHLYESLGDLHYKPLWTHSLLPPFEEIEHTADIAFKIQAESVLQLYTNALTALAFKCPEMMQFPHEVPIQTIDDIVMGLNRIISSTDAIYGCPFKAVSFHGEIEQINGIFTWEMIVDV